MFKKIIEEWKIFIAYLRNGDPNLDYSTWRSYEKYKDNPV